MFCYVIQERAILKQEYVTTRSLNDQEECEQILALIKHANGETNTVKPLDGDSEQVANSKLEQNKISRTSNGTQETQAAKPLDVASEHAANSKLEQNLISATGTNEESDKQTNSKATSDVDCANMWSALNDDLTSRRLSEDRNSSGSVSEKVDAADSRENSAAFVADSDVADQKKVV